MQWMGKQASDMALPDHTQLSRSFALHIWHIAPCGEMLLECCCTRTVLSSIQTLEQNHRPSSTNTPRKYLIQLHTVYLALFLRLARTTLNSKPLFSILAVSLSSVLHACKFNKLFSVHCENKRRARMSLNNHKDCPLLALPP